MNEIESLIDDASEFTPNEVIKALEKVGNRGDIMIIKNDGLRTLDSYTVVISSGNNNFDTIRYDAISLSDAIKKALKDYIELI